MAADNGTGDPEVKAFMREIMDALGVSTTNELIDLLAAEGLFRASELRKVYRWVGGQSAPRHSDTIKLLRRAGKLG